MKLNTLYSFLLSVLGLNLVAQELPTIIPPSPEAASIFKFNEVPVSLYSGLHNTSIPLLEINSGGVNIPINLSYHSRGVQVNEIASRVGTGWALNYGGMISRQIRGKADDLTFGYNNPTFDYTNNNSEPSFYSNSTERINELNDTNAQLLGQYDYYPDKFMINTNFFSGEFYFDKNNPEIITQKFSDIKIVPQFDLNDYKIIGFQVTDNLGNNYYFGGLDSSGLNFVSEYETTTQTFKSSQGSLTSSPGDNNYRPYTSWFLRKIVTNTNAVIDFLYNNENTTFYRRTGDSDQYTEGVPGEDITVPVTCHFSRIVSEQKVLSEIKFKEGKVTFVRSKTDRLDVQGGKTLERIDLFDAKNKSLKKIKFNYEYTTTTDVSNINNTALTNDSYAKNRLFLKSINFNNGTGLNTEKKYSFEYDSQVLPSRHSNSIDFWGYYNGKNRGLYINYENTDDDEAVVDPIKVQAGLLKKIIYPTGGFSTFEYEPNIVRNFLPTFNQLQFESNSNPQPTGEGSAYTIPNTNPNLAILKSEILSYIEPESYNYSATRYEKPIVISSSDIGPFIAEIDPCNFSFTCRLINDNREGPSYTLGTTSGQISIPEILPGSYKLVFDPADPNWNPTPNGDVNNTINHMFIVTLKWYDNSLSLENELYGPGNRIKKITNFSANSTVVNSKLYSYQNESGTYSNGALFSTANYRIILYKVGQFNTYERTMYRNNGMFNSFSKDNFGYHSVNEYLLDNNGNEKDKITYKYSLYSDYGCYFRFPYHPVSDNDWVRGLELKKIIYKKENEVFKKIKEINNSYLLYNSIPIYFDDEFNGPSPIDTMMSLGIEIHKPQSENFASHPYIRNKVQFCYPNSTGTNLNHYVFNSPLVYGYRTSFFVGGTLDKKSTKEIDYFDNGSVMETLTNYEYDYNNHYNLAKTITSNSLGETLETRYQYAPNGLNSAMVSKNMVAIPLKTETFRNNEKLSEQKTDYKNWDNVLLAPEFIKTSKGNDTPEVRVKYNLVDSNSGNPLEVQQEGGIKIVYIWGYNKSQPIAKIENASYADVQSYVSNLQTLSDVNPTITPNAEANLISALNNLRNALPNAMVTTYTYKQLIGVSTITDPKGLQTTYTYDQFNRLEYVKDYKGNILKQNEYHYKN